MRVGKCVGGARLLSVVTLIYLSRADDKGCPTERDYKAVRKAHKRLKEIFAEWEYGGKNGSLPCSRSAPPTNWHVGFRVQRYGMSQWGDLLTVRQKVALMTFAQGEAGGTTDAGSLTALNLSQISERNNSLCQWYPDPYMETVGTVYGRQALPIV